jgi:hypothetical protein
VTGTPALAGRWRHASSSERANAELYALELCDAPGVEKPRPAGTGYEFEYAVRIVHRDGTETVGRIDLFKEGCFLLEAKDEGTASRNSDLNSNSNSNSNLRSSRAHSSGPPFRQALVEAGGGGVHGRPAPRRAGAGGTDVVGSGCTAPLVRARIAGRR